MERVSKRNYYLDIAQTVLERATCLRRVYGAIIVKNDEIISTGYNGAPRGRKNCVDLGYCTREQLKVPRGERYELCRSVHAEANAIISAARSECSSSTFLSSWATPGPKHFWSVNILLEMTTRSSRSIEQHFPSCFDYIGAAPFRQYGKK